jgi:hypothetical protein
LPFKNPRQLSLSSLSRAVFQNRIWWLALFSLIGFCMYLRYDAQVFPSASINLELPRGTIIHKARQLAGEFGYNKLRAIESTQFTFDEEADFP